MRHVLALPVIILATALAGTASLSSRGERQQSVQPAVTAITGATLIDGTGRPPELELLVEAGLTPVQAIQAATGNAAKFVAGDTADWGTIETGKRADLVLVTGRPHERIGDTRTIADVVLAGRRLDRGQLRIQPGDPAYRTSGTMYNPTPR
jgi:hypothetical protein